MRVMVELGKWKLISIFDFSGVRSRLRSLGTERAGLGVGEFGEFGDRESQRESGQVPIRSGGVAVLASEYFGRLIGS